MTVQADTHKVGFRAMHGSNKSNGLFLVGQAILTFLCLFIILRLWRADLTVPFNYQGDTIFELSLVKSIASGDWIWFNSRLGAPFGFDSAAFPQNITFSSLVMKAISLFSSEPGTILNCFWLISCIFTSLMCHISLTSLGISRSIAIVLSTLYALLPYALLRNTAHISLTYAFVPVVAAYAVWVFSQWQHRGNTNTPRSPIAPALLAFACVAIGFDYIYNAFFACLFFAISGCFGSLYGRNTRPLKLIAPYITIVVICSVTNLIPSLLSWYSNGVPPNMGYKSPADAEIYGLKIRQVISSYLTDDVSGHVTFPLENENAFARLGIVLAVGYLLALAAGLFGRRAGNSNIAWAAGILTIAGTLFATVGGFGAVFNLVISPDIRAYNRMIVFLAFFACIVLGVALEWLRTSSDRYLARLGFEGSASPVFYALMTGLLLLGLFDQSHAARPLIHRYGSDLAQTTDERGIVANIEHKFPEVRQIYQLPNTKFPPDPGHNRMWVYDHGRPYLWSNNIKWSWPSFSYQYEAWLEKIGSPESVDFVRKLVISGFDGIWIDRFGYGETELTNLEAALGKELGSPATTSGTGRYAFYSLVEQRNKLRAGATPDDIAKLENALLNDIIFRFDKGFYDEEVSGTSSDTFRWSGKASRALLANPSGEARRVRLTAAVQSNPGGKLEISTNGTSKSLSLDGGAGDIDLPINLPPHSRYKIEFRFSGPRIAAPGDARSMYFALMDPMVIEDK